MEIFELGKLPVTESDLLVVQLPEGDHPLLEDLQGAAGGGD